MVDRLFPFFCSSCTRIGGKQGGGKYINGKRCTGACLHWAYHALDKLLAQGELQSKLRRPGSLWYMYYQCLTNVFTEVNDLGFAYWQQLLAHEPQKCFAFSEERLLYAVEYLQIHNTHSRVASNANVSCDVSGDRWLK